MGFIGKKSWCKVLEDVIKRFLQTCQLLAWSSWLSRCMKIFSMYIESFVIMFLKVTLEIFGSHCCMLDIHI
jgi:hypothetical protein